MIKNVSSYFSVRSIGIILMVGLVYYLSARTGLLLAYKNTNATPIWPPSGIALAAVLLFGYRVWPGILISAFTVNLIVFLTNKTTDMPTAIWVSSLISIGNTSEALLGFYLLKKSGENISGLEKIRNVFQFTFVVLMMSLASSIIGTTTICLADIASWTQYPTVWLIWWFGDVSGTLIIAPLLLSLAIYFNTEWKWDKKTVEASILYLITFIISVFVFGNWLPSNSPIVKAYIVLPLLLWAAIRFELLEVVTAIAISSIVAVLGTANGYGPFISGSQTESLLSLQLYISIVSVCILTLRAAINENKKALVALQFSENFLNSIIENIPNMIFVKEAKELKFVRFNKAGEELLGYSKEELVGKNDYDFFPKNEADFFIEKDKKVFDTGKLLEIEEEAIHTKHKGVRILETKKIPILDYFGNPIYLLGISRDITDQKKIEAELERKTKELARSNTELEQFAYVASHDLQEPLRTVATYLQLLEKRYKDKLDQDATDFIAHAIGGSNRMRALIHSILEYSRINRIKPFEVINMKLLLKEVLENLRTSIKENNVIIKINELPEIYGDYVLINQLFQNLIENAIKFRKTIDPEIVISGKKEKGGYLFSVKDNGIGMKKEFINKIFDIFQRLNSREEYSGTGIGLAIGKKIVERHGGEIWVESEIGKGSTFYFTIKELNNN
ncbi:MAG: MASE1 domain-containing protein [Bacteroidota bacterium]